MTSSTSPPPAPGHLGLGWPVHRNPLLDVPESCHIRAMARVRVSTTVDQQTLTTARQLRQGVNDAVLLDEALAALIARHRAAQIDAEYAAYDEHPLDEPDAWGDLASWSDAAGRS